MNTSWQSISGIVQGDITYDFRTSALSNSEVDFTLVAYSEKWEKFDISFEFRAKKEEAWRKDAFLTLSNANSIDANRIIGLDASKYGAINFIRWSFAQNAISYGEGIEVRLNILPRIRYFSTSGSNNMVSQSYGRQLSALETASTSVKILNTNNDGNYICADATSVYVRETPDGDNLLSMSGFINPVHVIQRNDRNYIIADENGLTEIDENFTATSIPTFSDERIRHFDYNEAQETILVTLDGAIKEKIWSAETRGDDIWKPELDLLNVQSATYNTRDSHKIAIADGDNILLVDRTLNTISTISRFHFYEQESTLDEITNFSQPFRVFWDDETIYVIEKEGRVLTFEDMMSTSSSLSSESSGP